jgi:PAS domain S-box-containing protein
MTEPLIKTRNTIREWTIWIALFILPLLFYPRALSSSWVSNSDVHSLLEFWAAATALLAAGIVLIHFFATGRRFFLLISLGFTLQGAEDLIHAIYSFSRIWPVEQVGIINFVPGTYVTGRLILAICLLLALYYEKKRSFAKDMKREAIIFSSIGFLLAVITTTIVINSPLPQFILPGQIISRPVDFTAAIIYLIAFSLFVGVYRDKEHRTPFMWCMIGSIIFGFATQVYMIHSQQLYDAQFDISHLVKIFSYIFPVFGIAIGTFAMYKKEEQLSEEWNKTFDAISDLVFIQDTNYTIVKTNKAFADALKLKPEQTVGKKCYKLLHNRNEPWPECSFERTIQDKKPHVQEVDDPNIGLPLLVSTSPIFDSKGELQGSVHIAKDISELKKARERMEEALRIKSEFTSMVSHELRTPLTAIKEGIGIVWDETAGKIKKDQKDFLGVAKRNVDRLARLIDDVLSFQKLEAGKMKFDMVENDMNEVIEEIQKQMTPLAKEKGLKLTVKPAKEPLKLRFDRDRIIQVMTNLVNNAVKFTEKGGITINTAQEGNIIHVSVKDTGRGMKHEDIPRLFHSFEQIESGKDRKTGGTGLGLAISKDIVESHKGKIWAESEFGKGATFHFILPIKERRT